MIEFLKYKISGHLSRKINMNNMFTYLRVNKLNRSFSDIDYFGYSVP